MMTETTEESAELQQPRIAGGGHRRACCSECATSKSDRTEAHEQVHAPVVQQSIEMMDNYWNRTCERKACHRTLQSGRVLQQGVTEKRHIVLSWGYLGLRKWDAQGFSLQLLGTTSQEFQNQLRETEKRLADQMLQMQSGLCMRMAPRSNRGRRRSLKAACICGTKASSRGSSVALQSRSRG